jgi:hypothetical protein
MSRSVLFQNLATLCIETAEGFLTYLTITIFTAVGGHLVFLNGKEL